jgi:lysylphosphatidylglycerol synthetase-like protein (DUF2156 family)
VKRVTAYALYNRMVIAAGEPISSRDQMPEAIDKFTQLSQQ